MFGKPHLFAAGDQFTGLGPTPLHTHGSQPP